MQFLAAALVAVCAKAVADASNQGHHGGSHAWVRDFENLVAFGDSFTDENRYNYFVAHHGAAPPPGLLLPESNLTASGGIIWDRWVSKYTGAKLYNYAVSGAACNNKMIYQYLPSISGPYPDLIYEVDAFIADVKYINSSTGTNTLYTNRRSDNTVYSMWIGTNDLRNGGFITDSSLNGTTIPDFVDCVFDRFDDIYKNGARYFVLMNIAPLQLAPLFAMPPYGLAASHIWTDKPANISEVSGKIKEYSKLINDIFDYRIPYELLIAKRYPGASFAIFDVNSLMTEIYNNPIQYFASPANVTGQFFSCDITGTNCTVQASVGLSHFMWLDELHPSEPTDEAIANEFVKLVKGTSKYATYW